MKKVLSALSTLTFSAVLFTACSKTNHVEQVDAVDNDIKRMVTAAGFNSNQVVKQDGGYVVEGDLFFTKDELKEMGDNFGPNLIIANNEQYRTTNLVKGLPRTLKVKMNISGKLFEDALKLAIKRYNDEKLRLKFKIVTSGTADITIRSMNEGRKSDGTLTLGRSDGFPRKNGDPAPGFKLNINKIAYGSKDVTREHLATVMAHEIGHTIGFRHTDYKDRSVSCGGDKKDEGKGDVGAVHIPGTPKGADGDKSSWMLACIGFPTESSPFTKNDVEALKYLY